MNKEEEFIEEKESKKTEEIKQEKKENKVWHIVKLIFFIITAPVWFPWKVLFVRRKNRKFKDMSTPIKVFRVLRSPITLPLKFCIFMLIIGIEIFIGYKIRFSPVTYPLTRASVYSHYLQKSNNKLDGAMGVSACELNTHYEEFKTAFSYIDKWDIDSKNKMYVVLDADITKFVFEYIDDASVSYILNRFNTEPELRDDIKMISKDVNKILNRGIKEFPEMVPYDDFDIFLEPASSIGGMVDYRQALDIIWAGVSTMINTNMVEIDNSYTATEIDFESYDLCIDSLVYYSKGHTIVETYNYINEKYKDTDFDYSEENTNVIISDYEE